MSDVILMKSEVNLRPIEQECIGLIATTFAIEFPAIEYDRKYPSKDL